MLCAGFSLCYMQSLVCLMCRILCLWLAAEAARGVLMIHADAGIYIYICRVVNKGG